MLRTSPRILLVAGAASAALVLSGCASGTAPAESTGVQVLASTDVYGDIAATIGGDAVSVTAIITDPTADPHTYESTSRDLLAAADAAVVVMNGGGYDSFMDRIIDAAGDSPIVIDAAAIAGVEGHEHGGDEHADEEPAATEESAAAETTTEQHAEDEHTHDDHSHEDSSETPATDAPIAADTTTDDHAHENEHVWYDLHVVEEVATEIAHALEEADPSNAALFEANLADFTAGIEDLEARTADAATRFGGTGVAITEPVPVYMLEAMGLENRTPEAFSSAVEEETDVSPAVLQQTLDLLSGSDPVAALVLNTQTGDSTTDRVRTAAEAAGVPVVEVTETLPDGDDYLGWMGDTITAIETALS